MKGVSHEFPAPTLRLIDEARTVLRSALTDVLAGHDVVAVVDFPNHDNSGDSAIYLGQLHTLRALGVSVGYVSDRTGFSSARLRRAIGSAPVLINGGGNFGDLWPTFQQHREQIVATLPDNPIIQLPQSITFLDESRIDGVGQILRRHGGVTVFVRDERSYALVRDELQVPARLTPDMAFGIGPIARRADPRVDVLWLARRDKESGMSRDVLARVLGDLAAGMRVEEADWHRESPVRRRARFSTKAAGRVSRSAGLAALRVDRLLAPAMDRLARDRVRVACEILSAGRVVVTDRLHGHILCVLLGIPHVVVDNQHGKLSAYHSRWTRDSGVATFADSPEHAAELARQQLSRSYADGT